MREIHFTVKGAPVAKARPRMNRSTGIVYTPKKTQDAERVIKAAFLAKVEEHNIPTKNPVEVKITYFYEPPKSYSKAKREALMWTGKTTKPDLDNLTKTVLDALNGVAWEDDAQVVKLSANKTYAQSTYTHVTITWKE